MRTSDSAEALGIELSSIASVINLRETRRQSEEEGTYVNKEFHLYFASTCL